MLVAPLAGNWTAVQTSNARTNLAAFRAALANAEEVGFVNSLPYLFGEGVANVQLSLIHPDFNAVIF